MKAKKLLSMLLAVSMIGAMMTGCGSKTEDANTATADTATVDTTTVDTTAEATTEAGTEAADGAVETTEAVEAGVEIAAGTYAGTYTKEAMGSEIVYEYSLILNEDNTYNYQVSFVMGGEEYPEEEAGTYTIEGNVITLTPAEPLKDLDAAITVTSAEAGKINFTRCVSSFASAQVDLEAALTE